MDDYKIDSLDDITAELFGKRLAKAFLEVRGSNLTFLMYKAFPELDDIEFDGPSDYESLMQVWEMVSGTKRKE